MRFTEMDFEKALLSIPTKIYLDKLPATADMDVAVHAIKKQIGKKIVRSSKYGSHRCPVCDKVVFRSEHYCSQCGQKLDWRL